MGFLKVLDSIMEQKGIGSLVFLNVLVLQWYRHLCFLIYVCSKLKVTQNISNFQEWPKHAEMQIFAILYKTFTLGGGFGQGLPKTLSEWPHLASGCFMKLFYKKTTCPKIKCLFVIFGLVYDIFDSIGLTQNFFLAD